MVNFFYLDIDPKICAQYYCNKHIIKIPIEIAQILSKVHYEFKSGIDYNKIYKNSLVVKNTLGPYIWITQSLDNYIWTCNLGLELVNEYKFRYNKTTFKTQIIIETLLNNLPNLPKIGKTKFIGTNQFDMFQFISDDPIICARYNYCEMKCSNDIWTNRQKPDWFENIKKIILRNKQKLIIKINEQVRKVLPSLVEKGDRVYRFHSFLRVSYDHLFQGKWDVKAKVMNKYDKNKPLLYQLTYPQLYYLYEITKSLKNKKILSILNVNSLRYRKKLKFPNNKIDYNKNPEYYVYNISYNDAHLIKPYNKTILPIFNIDNYKDAKKSCLQIFNLFNNYILNNDFIGADVCRKFIQLAAKSKSKYNDIFSKKIIIINNNNKYIEWCNTFNWKNSKPLIKKYILR
jgi:hypothetical protein